MLRHKKSYIFYNKKSAPLGFTKNNCETFWLFNKIVFANLKCIMSKKKISKRYYTKNLVIILPKLKL